MVLLFVLFFHGVKMLMKKISIPFLGHTVVMINALHSKDQKARLCYRNGLCSHSVFIE